MSPYLAAVILAALVIAAITGIYYLFCLKNPEFKVKKQRQGSRRNISVKGGVAAGRQENGYFLKNMQQINTVHINVAERGRVCKLILRDVKTNKILFQGSFSGKLLLGRGEEANGRQKLVLKDPEISKEHCVIWNREGRLYIRDLHSKNHTYLNGKPVTGMEELRTEDILSLGGMWVQVFFGY